MTLDSCIVTSSLKLPRYYSWCLGTRMHVYVYGSYLSLHVAFMTLLRPKSIAITHSLSSLLDMDVQMRDCTLVSLGLHNDP